MRYKSWLPQLFLRGETSEMLLGQEFFCLGHIRRRQAPSEEESDFCIVPFGSAAPRLANDLAVYFLATRKDKAGTWEVRFIGTARALASVMGNFAIETKSSARASGIRSPQTIHGLSDSGYEVSLWRADFASGEPCRILFRDALKYNFSLYGLDSMGHWCFCDFCKLFAFHFRFSEVSGITERRLLLYIKQWVTLEQEWADHSNTNLRVTIVRALHTDDCACLACTWSIIGEILRSHPPDASVAISTLFERYLAKNRLDVLYAFWRSGYVLWRRRQANPSHQRYIGGLHDERVVRGPFGL